MEIPLEKDPQTDKTINEKKPNAVPNGKDVSQEDADDQKDQDDEDKEFFEQYDIRRVFKVGTTFQTIKGVHLLEPEYNKDSHADFSHMKALTRNEKRDHPEHLWDIKADSNKLTILIFWQSGEPIEGNDKALELKKLLGFFRENIVEKFEQKREGYKKMAEKY